MSYFDSCVSCDEPFKKRSYDWAICDSCKAKLPKCIICKEPTEQGNLCDMCHYEKQKQDQITEDSKTFEQVTKDYFIEKKLWNFDLECIYDRYCCENNHDSILWHLISHDEKFKKFSFDNWHYLFTTFSVGDSYSCDWRCRLCNAEFLFEREAREHLRSHNIKYEVETN